MAKTKLDKYESQIVKDFESDEFRSVMSDSRKSELEKIAENTFKKDKRINIRISSRDLSALQRRALEEGMPYQTLISSILHKYISGGLSDVMAKKAVNRSS